VFIYRLDVMMTALQYMHWAERIVLLTFEKDIGSILAHKLN